jgi:molecular chaperone GrpE
VYDRRFWQLDEEALAAEEPRAKAPTYIEQLESRLKEKDDKLREYIAAYKKEVVENLEQTKQRLQREAEQQLKRTRGDLAAPMIEVLEALERSLAAAQMASDPGALVEGVRMVRSLMVQKLEAIGLSRIDTVGQPFDPAVHDAVAVAPVNDATQDRVVVAELSPGFTLDGQVFRPAKVQVGQLQR